MRHEQPRVGAALTRAPPQLLVYQNVQTAAAVRARGRNLYF
jgi:hypothetical protein